MARKAVYIVISPCQRRDQPSGWLVHLTDRWRWWDERCFTHARHALGHVQELLAQGARLGVDGRPGFEHTLIQLLRGERP